MKATTAQINEAVTKDGQEILQMLVEKNSHYNNAAATPFNVFSSGDPLTKIKVRIDDKLARIRHFFQSESEQTTLQTIFSNEDTIADLIGYLLLLRTVARFAMGQDKADSDVTQNGIESEQSYIRRKIHQMEDALFELQNTRRPAEDTITLAVEDVPKVSVDRRTKAYRRKAPATAAKRTRKK